MSEFSIHPAEENDEGIGKTVEYSVVLPVFNEQESLRPLFSELLQVMPQLGRPYEIIFVDDGSTDGSTEILNEFEKELKGIARVVSLDKQSGQTFALKKGLAQIKGRIVVTLDADLQNDPVDIKKLIAKMNEGYDCVCGWRKSRHDLILKTVLSKCGNILQRLFTGMKIHDVSCTLRAYRAECIHQIDLDWDGQHRFIPISLFVKGYRIGEVIAHHRRREFGTSKYTHKRIFGVIKDFFKVLRMKGKK